MFTNLHCLLNACGAYLMYSLKCLCRIVTNITVTIIPLTTKKLHGLYFLIHPFINDEHYPS